MAFKQKWERQTESATTNPISRGIQLALFATALAWAAAASVIAERAANGLATRFPVATIQILLQNCFLLFLLVVGLRMLDFIATRGRYDGEILPLPQRRGRWREWGVGAAVGWGLCLATVLPLLLTAHLHGRFSWSAGSLFGIVWAAGALLAGVLAQEVIFRGYALRRLSDAFGTSWAAVAMAVVYGVFLIHANPPANTVTALLDGILLALVLTLAWARTRAMWLGWGLHFSYRAVAALVLGLPIAGRGDFASLLDSYVSGPRWLSGGAFGLDAAAWTALVMLGGLGVVYRVTRDYAWEYTFQPIVPGGYEVAVAPPAAHVAMEKAAAPPPLVQILPVTPGAPPPPPRPLEQDTIVR